MHEVKSVQSVAKTVFGGLFLFVGTDFVLYFFGKSVFVCIIELLCAYMPAMLIAFSKKIPGGHKKYILGFLFLYKFLYVSHYLRMRVLFGTILFVVSVGYAIWYTSVYEEHERNNIIMIWPMFFCGFTNFFMMPGYAVCDEILLKLILGFGIVGVVIAYAILKTITRRREDKVRVFFIHMILITFVVGMAFTNLNYALDYNEKVPITAQIVEKRPGGYRSTPAISIEYSGKEYDYFVSQAVYERNKVGDSVSALYCEGFFGIPYVEYNK